MASRRFVVSNGVLKAASGLRREYLNEFCEAARSLLGEPTDRVVIDLSDADHIFSSFIGVLGNLSQDCHNIGKTLTVRVPERLAWILDIDRNLSVFMKIERVPDR
jgi:anti-anti-sigma regulatory factor